MENSGKQNPKMGFKSPPEQRRPPKGHALKYFLRASQPCKNWILPRLLPARMLDAQLAKLLGLTKPQPAPNDLPSTAPEEEFHSPQLP